MGWTPSDWIHLGSGALVFDSRVTNQRQATTLYGDFARHIAPGSEEARYRATDTGGIVELLAGGAFTHNGIFMGIMPDLAPKAVPATIGIDRDSSYQIKMRRARDGDEGLLRQINYNIVNELQIGLKELSGPGSDGSITNLDGTFTTKSERQDASMATLTSAVLSSIKPAKYAVTVYRVQGGTQMPNVSRHRIISANNERGFRIKGDDYLFVGFDKKRALQFAEKRGDAHIVAFDVDSKVLDRFRQIGILEREVIQSNKGTALLKVDREFPDQFGVPSNMFSDLLHNYIPNTFRILKP